ncbi:MAG: hypothetical protein LUD52_05450 [Opitutae bacterium]|nr:hypothetical protein [Opitutae bacterium]
MTTTLDIIFIARSFTPRTSTKSHIISNSIPPLVSLAETNATNSRATVFAANDFEPKTQNLFVTNANDTATHHAMIVAGMTYTPTSLVAIA